MKNNARISYSERKQLGRSQNIKHAKVPVIIVKIYLNGEFIEVPYNKRTGRIHVLPVFIFISLKNPGYDFETTSGFSISIAPIFNERIESAIAIR